MGWYSLPAIGASFGGQHDHEVSVSPGGAPSRALQTLHLPAATPPLNHAGFGATVPYYGTIALIVAAWLAGAAAVWLLWRPASSAFFKPQGLAQALSCQG